MDNSKYILAMVARYMYCLETVEEHNVSCTYAYMYIYLV